MLDKLLELMPPPERPCFAEGDWEAIEQAIGLRLPSDYKAFVGAYGAGCVCKKVVIHSPFVWLANGREVRQAWIDWASMFDDYAEYGGVEIPYPLFPAPGGLLPFGSLGDVDSLNWLTSGEPEEWPFVYYDRDAGFFEVKGLSTVEFVLEAITCRSPTLIRSRSDSGFKPPYVFESFADL